MSRWPERIIWLVILVAVAVAMGNVAVVLGTSYELAGVLASVFVVINLMLAAGGSFELWQDLF